VIHDGCPRADLKGYIPQDITLISESLARLVRRPPGGEYIEQFWSACVKGLRFATGVMIQASQLGTLPATTGFHFSGVRVLDHFNNGSSSRNSHQGSPESVPNATSQRHPLGATGPYVINLGVSNTPFKMPAGALPNLEHLHIYQVRRVEDGRVRYRLRLGPITSELEADALLSGVRQRYPVAFTAMAGEDDRRVQPKEGLLGAALAPVNLAAPVASPKPFGQLMEINHDHLPAVDHTQTLRVLSATELREDVLSKWFVIQLAVADSAFRPEDVLNLDIFHEFSLYSTVGLEEGRLLHALRLGFFSEQSAALTVASYVRQYFGATIIKRVSIAERERFAEGRVVARKHSEATGIHEVVELSTPATAPATNLSVLSSSLPKKGSDDRSLKFGTQPRRKR
jgi:hypothetical protein